MLFMYVTIEFSMIEILSHTIYTNYSRVTYATRVIYTNNSIEHPKSVIKVIKELIGKTIESCESFQGSFAW